MTAHPGIMQIDLVAVCFLVKVLLNSYRTPLFDYPKSWQINRPDGLLATLINQ